AADMTFWAGAHVEEIACALEAAGLWPGRAIPPICSAGRSRCSGYVRERSGEPVRPPWPRMSVPERQSSLPEGLEALARTMTPQAGHRLPATRNATAATG